MNACGICGADPARGLASINDVPYCHDDSVTFTCYQAAQIFTTSLAETSLADETCGECGEPFGAELGDHEPCAMTVDTLMARLGLESAGDSQ